MQSPEAHPTPASRSGVANERSVGASGAWQRPVWLVSLVLSAVCVVALVRLLPVGRLVQMLSAYVEQLGPWGPVAFGVAYVIAAVLFVPGSALTLASGTVFGLALGTAVVSLASTTAAAISFLIGRYLARDAVQQWAVNSPRFAAIDRAIGERGWKIILMLRLSPAVPFSLGNYLYGLTSIRFRPYVLTSWLAMLPGTFMYVYLGHAGRVGIAVATGDRSRSLGQWLQLAVGLAVSVVVTIYIARLARKAIRESADMSAPVPPPGPTESRVLATAAMAFLAAVLVGLTACAYSDPARVSGLFGPPAVKLEETYAEKPSRAGFDHAPFDALLRKHVTDAGLVDYRGLMGDATALDAYVAAIATAPLAEMGRTERLALLLNAYNAFTLRLILDHSPVGSIKDIPSDQRWAAERWNLGGETVSLDQIENKLIRPNFKEPRIHFALVCAARGCPPLRNEAYVPDRLEEQLEAQAVYVHTHDTWAQFDAAENALELTQLYNWYGGDFAQVAGSVTAYAARYLPQVAAALEAGRTPSVGFLDYDWGLNTTEKR